MSKRSREEESHRPSKRTKSDRFPKPPIPTEEIHFPRQLQELLTFRQDGIPQLRDGIAAFKSFLEVILYQHEAEDRGKKLSILREFLESQKPADVKDTDHPFLAHLWQAWSFASAEHNDSLSSAVSAILALLVKTLSHLLDFRELGFLLCRTVLQHQHLRLVKKCLDAPRQKEHVASPCLRLLTEVVNFDGGVLAREMYKRREETFEVGVLRRNLGMLKTENLGEEDAHRRPAIRTLTLRYILAFFKYLHEGGKADILKQRPLASALFGHLREDPPDLVNELLAVTEQNVFKDEELSRAAKAALLTQQNLRHVSEVATRLDGQHPSAAKAFAWLKAVATTHSYGVYRSSGWYPPGTARGENQTTSSQMIDLGLNSLEFYDSVGAPDIRNSTLLAWTQSLRPHSNELERELALTCFKAAPELVAAYFVDMKVQLEPTLSNTWLSYASFVFECVALPVPEHLGSEPTWAPLPPQTTIMIESILPRPLNQKVLTRCLNQSSDLITFFAIRILIIALGKMKEVLERLAEREKSTDVNADLWHEAAERLKTRFTERCPNMKDVIATFRKIPDDDDHLLQREAIARLLRLYYEVLPLEAMEEQFDISAALTAALISSQDITQATERTEVRSLELEHLLQISRYSPGMRWFGKQGSLEFSPMVTLLRLHCRSPHSAQIRHLILHVLKEADVVNESIQLDALVASVLGLESKTSQVVWAFIDDCLLRLVRKPVKYLDDLEELGRSAKSKTASTPSEIQAFLLVAVVLEQAAFVPAKKDGVQIMAWTGLLMEVIQQADENQKRLGASAQKKLSAISGWDNTKASSKQANKLLSNARLPQGDNDVSTKDVSSNEDGTSQAPFDNPTVESENHRELLKWGKKDLDMALEDGDIAALMLCLCSQRPAIRTQALTQLYKLEDSLRDSNLEDKDPIYVLVGELIETYEQHCVPRAEPLPYIAGTFATQALKVQMEPTHFMYPKINKYLQKGPDWRINKLPVYWLENTVLDKPEEDDAYWKEIQWVLDWLVDGLRTSADLEVLRRGAVFEKIMTLYASPSAATNRTVRERVLEIIWRCSFVDGGSTTLATRTGVLSWLNMISKRGEAGVELVVKRRILETCDQSRIESWSGMSTGDM